MSMRRVSALRYVASAFRRAASTAPRHPTPSILKSTPSPSSGPNVPRHEPHNARNSSVTSISPPSPPKTGFRILPGLLAGLFAGGIALYSVTLIIAARRPCEDPGIAELANQKDVVSRYDVTADSFDSEVGFSEFLMGINSTRKKLARMCTGHVLEVSCGTGRNLSYYDLSRDRSLVDSLTFVDISPAMIEVCKRKWSVLTGEGTGGKKEWKMKPGLVVRFLTGSALEGIPPAPATPVQQQQRAENASSSRGPSSQKYDTIIQTMGLCSTSSPVELLLNMASYLNTSNPDARILLLEHGRSYHPWLNNILDGSAAKHAEIHGCWFNRDIGALVEEAAQLAGLEVTRERRHHLGTTWVFELVPSEEMRKKGGPLQEVKRSGVDDVVAREGGFMGGWWNWLGWQ